MHRLASLLLVVPIIALTAGIAWWTTTHEAKSQEQITGPTKVLVAALQANDPSAAPEGADGYVEGVREQFGRIRAARFLDAYTDRYGTGNTAGTDTVSEILVRGSRGAGVLKVTFDGATVSGLWEVKPGEVHTELSPADQAAVERGFARRGGEPANITVLDGTFTRDGQIR